jgi:LPS export ABC transporter protein LptC
MVLLGVLGTMAALGIWLQVSLLEPPAVKPALSSTHEPDYYIQEFTATGRDEAGVIYVLKAERLVHFPDDNTSLLDAPHLVQYQGDQPLRHTTSESGWLSGDGKDVLRRDHPEPQRRGPRQRYPYRAPDRSPRTWWLNQLRHRFGKI